MDNQIGQSHASNVPINTQRISLSSVTRPLCTFMPWHVANCFGDVKLPRRRETLQVASCFELKIFMHDSRSAISTSLSAEKTSSGSSQTTALTQSSYSCIVLWNRPELSVKLTATSLSCHRPELSNDTTCCLHYGMVRFSRVTACWGAPLYRHTDLDNDRPVTYGVLGFNYFPLKICWISWT